MHHWYDPKLFDLLTHEKVMAEYAAKDDVAGVPVDTARTADDLLRVGLDVRYFGSAADGNATVSDGAAAEPPDEVEEEVFCRWASTAPQP